MLQKIINTFKKIASKAGATKTYEYAGIKIKIPADHMLPVYKRKFKNYDRFLPYLVKSVTGGVVIDVGANVGDTLLAMAAENPACHFVPIEADDCFYDLLIENSETIRKKLTSVNITPVKFLVGMDVSGVALDGFGGTKKAVIGSGSLTAKPLDKIVEGLSIAHVVLIKSDVDGFDYDVLDSAWQTISQSSPLLYFECQTDFEFQLIKLKTSICRLFGLGYRNFYIFDNFGGFVMCARDASSIESLLNYIWMQNNKIATRTIWYYDILAVHERSFVDAEKIVNEYCQNKR